MRKLLEISDAVSDIFDVFQVNFVSLYVHFVIFALLDDCVQLLFGEAWTISIVLETVLLNAGQRFFDILHYWTFAIRAVIGFNYLFFFLLTYCFQFLFELFLIRFIYF